MIISCSILKLTCPTLESEGSMSCLPNCDTWSINGFGLNLASFQSMLDAPEPKTGPPAPAAPAETPLKEGVGQRRENGKGDNSMGDGDAILVGDAPP